LKTPTIALAVIAEFPLTSGIVHHWYREDYTDGYAGTTRDRLLDLLAVGSNGLFAIASDRYAYPSPASDHRHPKQLSTSPDKLFYSYHLYNVDDVHFIKLRTSLLGIC
jgi:hypothetical protein